jgi:hypothetical protein
MILPVAFALVQPHHGPSFFALFVVPLIVLLIIGALAIMRISPHGVLLRLKGMDLARNGRPAEAEQCYRKALARGSKVPPSEQVRLLVCCSGPSAREIS